jgi:hypothetical protein
MVGLNYVSRDPFTQGHPAQGDPAGEGRVDL